MGVPEVVGSMTPLLPSYWTFGSNHHDDTTQAWGDTICAGYQGQTLDRTAAA